MNISKILVFHNLDQVVHYHQWNDTGKLELSGATINGTCIGTYACTGDYSGVNNHGPGSVSSGIDFLIQIELRKMNTNEILKKK